MIAVLEPLVRLNYYGLLSKLWHQLSFTAASGAISISPRYSTLTCPTPSTKDNASASFKDNWLNATPSSISTPTSHPCTVKGGDSVPSSGRCSICTLF